MNAFYNRIVGAMWYHQDDKLNIDFPLDLFFTDEFLLKYYNLKQKLDLKEFNEWIRKNQEFLDDKITGERYEFILNNRINGELPKPNWKDRLKLR